MKRALDAPVPTATPAAGSNALRTKLAQAAPALQAAAADLWRPPGLPQRYHEYLNAMHGVIRASVPLMELAARRCTERGARDPVAAPLRAYLLRHIEQERGHDDWLLDDLAALGADRVQGPERQPAPAVAALVGPQYYWVEHDHPVTLLGYIAVMEGNAPAARLGDWIVSRAQVPETAVRTVREHAELDTAHTREVYDLLDTLELSPAQATGIAVNGLHSAAALLRLLTRLARSPHDTPHPGTSPPPIHPTSPKDAH